MLAFLGLSAIAGAVPMILHPYGTAANRPLELSPQFAISFLPDTGDHPSCGEWVSGALGFMAGPEKKTGSLALDWVPGMRFAGVAGGGVLDVAAGDVAALPVWSSRACADRVGARAEEYSSEGDLRPQAGTKVECGKMSLLLMVIPPERFRDEELFETRFALEGAGHTTRIASIRKGFCPGSRGGSAKAELALADVKPADYDGVVFVGGGGLRLLWDNPEAIGVASEMNRTKKLVAAICLAPVILANAGVLRGKRATVSGTEANTIVAKGAIYTGPGMTVDGNIVTANGPKSSRVFGEKIASLLAKSVHNQPHFFA
jgi:protease I